MVKGAAQRAVTITGADQISHPQRAGHPVHVQRYDNPPERRRASCRWSPTRHGGVLRIKVVATQSGGLGIGGPRLSKEFGRRGLDHTPQRAPHGMCGFLDGQRSQLDLFGAVPPQQRGDRIGGGFGGSDGGEHRCPAFLDQMAHHGRGRGVQLMRMIHEQRPPPLPNGNHLIHRPTQRIDHAGGHDRRQQMGQRSVRRVTCRRGTTHRVGGPAVATEFGRTSSGQATLSDPGRPGQHYRGRAAAGPRTIAANSRSRPANGQPFDPSDLGRATSRK